MLASFKTTCSKDFVDNSYKATVFLLHVATKDSMYKLRDLRRPISVLKL